MDNWTIIIATCISMVGTILAASWARKPASRVYDDLNNKHPDAPGTGDLIREMSTSIIAIASSLSVMRTTQEKHEGAIEEVAKIATRNNKRMDGMVTMIEQVGECRAPRIMDEDGG